MAREGVETQSGEKIGEVVGSGPVCRSGDVVEGCWFSVAVDGDVAQSDVLD